MTSIKLPILKFLIYVKNMRKSRFGIYLGINTDNVPGIFPVVMQ